MRNSSPGQKHILGWGFCLAAHDEVSRAPFTAGSSKPKYRLTVVGSRGMPVRLQMVWDNLSCLGTEALARLGLRLGGFQLMFQSSLSDGVAFDPFSFQKDGSASAEVDVGRCQVL